MPIAWAIAKGTLPIVGATKKHHVSDAFKACEITLSDDEIDMIESIMRPLEYVLQKDTGAEKFSIYGAISEEDD